MSAQTPKTPPSALHEILSWSADKPAWQRDALRRILLNDVLSAADLKDLEQLCRLPAKDAAAKAVPLDTSHLPASPASQVAVALVSLGKLTGVNRLSDKQVLSFGASPGLTVVNGDNGAGKSGYARVLKKACRARGVPPTIYPDAYSAAPQKAATGAFAYAADGTPTAAAWSDGSAADPLLGNVFIFDGSSAANYLISDEPASFTPFGLDLLPKLSRACDAMRDIINAERNKVSSEISSTTETWKVPPATVAGKAIFSLKATTTDKEIDVLAGLDAAQTKRHLELAALLKTNPKQKAKETRAAADRLTALAAKIKNAALALSAEEVAATEKCINDHKLAADAAKAFASGKFAEGYVPGTGAELWRKLWEAARAFSEKVGYPDKAFPATVGALCLLCQQDMTANAAERLTKFEAFVKDESQKLEKEAAELLKKTEEKFAKCSTLTDEWLKVETDAAQATPEQLNEIKVFVSNTDALLLALKDALKAKSWVDGAALPASPELVFTTLAAALNARAKEEESADDPTARKKLEDEHAELEARSWLGTNKAVVVAQIGRYKNSTDLEDALSRTNTAAITKLNSSLTEKLVSKAYCDQFNQEVKALGLRTIRVELEPVKGEKGKTKFGLRLVPKSKYSIQQIASEGEQRCISLAAFLAELSQATHKSGLVFDDPVTSLDHYHRYHIAQRLVNESKVRQVLVFTHDTVFLNDLITHAEEVGVQPRHVSLVWNGNEPGHVVDGLPWEEMKVKARLDQLDQACNPLISSWPPKPNAAQVEQIRGMYSKLRSTIERLVEQHILGDVVFRYRAYVKLTYLSKVIGFDQNECSEVERLFKKCSNITEAHDPASGKQLPVPTPSELKQDVGGAMSLYAKVKARQ